MPTHEPTVASGDKITLRLIGPRASIWPTSPATNQSLLARSDLVARPVVDVQLPDSPDLVVGSYTLRLDDAGEAAFTFPNVNASDGVPYRQRFDPAGHLQFLECYVNGLLEQVLVLDTVNPTDGRGFSSTLDATDFCASLWGNGAGLQNGTSGQLQAVVFDPATLANSLFDVQGWQDFSDAAFPSLLQALLNSQLGLKLTPWQLLSADPTSGGGGGQVGVHGQDAWFLLKKAYERDWTVVMAPRDVIERGTQVWVPSIADNVPYVGSTVPNARWTVTASGGASATIQPSGGLLLVATHTSTNAVVASSAISTSATGAWRTTASLLTYLFATGDDFQFQITESSGASYSMRIVLGNAPIVQLLVNATVVGQVTLAPPPASATIYTGGTLLLESDGEWVWGFYGGQFVGCGRRQDTSTTTLTTTMTLATSGAVGAKTALISGVFTEALQPLLERGTDKGDYVLPGVASTYPSGGLHARYYNDLDLQSDSNWLSKILAPNRSQAYSGSGGPGEYQNQQDAQIDNQANPTPGAASTYWSVKWFGAIWLPLSQGDIGIGINAPAWTGFRVWIGKTRFGDQLIDHWNASSNSTTYNAVTALTAASLAGTLPYGGGTVPRDGWYPIKIEYVVGNVSAVAPILFLAGPSGGNIPYNWTDPGGTSYNTSQSFANVAATSLSPLGCVDQRYQGMSHFDLVQQTVTGFGYQASVEPYKFETLSQTNQPGYFPGQLAPRVREGHDTDLILEPDKGPRQDWTGTLKPQLANTWPLPGSLAAMRWRPGDGIRVRDREINVYDTVPRQILTFVRNLLPDGIQSAVASLANRPRTAAKALKQQLYTVSRLQRNYQRQKVTLQGAYAQANITTGQVYTSINNTPLLSLVQLQAGDQIVRAQVRISSTVGGVALGIAVNGTDQTTTLNGPWTALPATIDITAVAAPDSAAGMRTYVAILNKGASTASDVNFQLFVEVLR